MSWIPLNSKVSPECDPSSCSMTMSLELVHIATKRCPTEAHATFVNCASPKSNWPISVQRCHRSRVFVALALLFSLLSNCCPNMHHCECHTDAPNWHLYCNCRRQHLLLPILLESSLLRASEV